MKKRYVYILKKIADTSNQIPRKINWLFSHYRTYRCLLFSHESKNNYFSKLRYVKKFMIKNKIKSKLLVKPYFKLNSIIQHI